MRRRIGDRPAPEWASDRRAQGDLHTMVGERLRQLDDLENHHPRPARSDRQGGPGVL